MSIFLPFQHSVHHHTTQEKVCPTCFTVTPKHPSKPCSGSGAEAAEAPWVGVLFVIHSCLLKAGLQPSACDTPVTSPEKDPHLLVAALWTDIGKSGCVCQRGMNHGSWHLALCP